MQSRRSRFFTGSLLVASCFGFFLVVGGGCKKAEPPASDNRTPGTSRAALNITPGNAAQGKELYTTKGCLACHSLDGSKRIGPSFKGLFGSKRTVITGGKERIVTADIQYIALSIKEPKADVVKGYETQIMTIVPTSDKEIGDLIAFIQTLK